MKAADLRQGKIGLKEMLEGLGEKPDYDKLNDAELPVQDNWSLSLLKISLCRYKGTVYCGNLVICAHNYATHFGRLKNLMPGDKVIFTDIDGNEYRYTATEMENPGSTAIEEMESGQWDLTLFTCALAGRTRV